MQLVSLNRLGISHHIIGPSRFDFMPGMSPGAGLIRASSGGRTNAAGLIVIEPSDVARYTHNGATLAPRGLLNEGSRRNDTRNNAALDTWTGGATHVVANQAVAPNGVLEADLYKAASFVNPQLYIAWANAAATRYAWSGFWKRDPGAALPLDILYITQTGVGDQNIVRFNLEGAGTATRVSGSVPLDASGIQLWADGWYYCWASHTSILAGTAYFQANLVDPGGTAIAAPDANSGVFGWGPQSEVGDLPSSPIATAASAVTRAADVLTVPLVPGIYDMAIGREDGIETLPGVVVTGGSYTVPTSVSPLQHVVARRVG